MEATPKKCRYCKERPRYQDHPYCGRTCADKARLLTANLNVSPPRSAPPQATSFMSLGGPSSAAPAIQLHAAPSSAGPTISQRPSRSPVRTPSPLPLIDGTSSRIAPSPSPSPQPIHSTAVSPPPAGTRITCKIPECDQSPFQFGGDYCSDKHRSEAVKRDLAPPCIFCYRYPRTLYNFCGQNCNDRISNGRPSLISLVERDPKYEEVRYLFDINWKYTTKPKPKVVAVHKITLGKGSMSSFFAHRRNVEEARNFISQCRTPGNEGRRWFGTHRQCQIGDDPNWMDHCGDSECALCVLLKKGFSKGPPGRFGTGIYASALSSRADDFSSNRSASPSTLKVAVLATVIIGRGLKCLGPRPDLTIPPPGYDSVLTETGTSMTFDEVVVYTEDAIRPIWLVVYDTAQPT